MRLAARRPLAATTLVVALVTIALIPIMNAPAARPLNVSQSIGVGATLSGQVSWTASVSRGKWSGATVTFAIDGVVRSTDPSNPYAYNGNGALDTTTLSNGPHTFAVTATTPDGTATSTATANVQNTAAVFTVTQSLPNWSSLNGTVPWTATPTGISTTDVAKVDFLVDSQLVLTDTTSGYGDVAGFFDTTKIANGAHTFMARAVAKDGRTVTTQTTMSVSNTTSTPTPTPTPTPSPTPAPQPSLPIYATFYYPWFPETWTFAGVHVFYHPTLGYYSTADVATQQAHIRAMQYAKMNAAISSWWGPGHYTDTRLKQLMQTTLAMGSPLKWAVYEEGEGYGNPTVSQIATKLAYIRDNLATSPAYLKVGGKFVVFVYNADDTSCDVATRWAQANSQLGNPAYVDLKVFLGYKTCSNQPSSWHQYGPNVPYDDQPGYSFSIGPGFWQCNISNPLLPRDPTRWVNNVKAMAASNEPWRLVTTFNEWTEGTAIESASEWSSSSGYGTYLDALHNNIP